MLAQFLKFKKKKTQKGSSYGIVKFSDLLNVFELFIFSEIFEINRNILVEGNSLMLTLIKNYSNENKTLKRINVKKIISLNELINKQISNITFKFNNISEMEKLDYLDTENGETVVKILLNENNRSCIFKLKNKRKINNKLLNSSNLLENVIVE